MSTRQTIKRFALHSSVAALALTIGLTVAPGAHADEADARNLLKAMSDYLAAQETFVHVDVADEAALREALNRTVAARPITRLVNNAGIVRPAGIDTATRADLQAVMDVNLAASMACVQALLPAMRASLEGATGKPWLMSGSGPTLFALYASVAEAAEVGKFLAAAQLPALEGALINAVDLVGPEPVWRFP